MAIIEYPLVQLLNYFTSMKPYLTWQTDMCTLEFVLIKNAKYIQEPWKLAFIFRIRAWNVWWSKHSWQNLLQAKAYKSVSLMEISKNSCSHVYCCNVYALTTCFITSAHWAVPVQSLILARNVHFILTGFEKENFLNNDRSSPCANQFAEIYKRETTDLNRFASTLTVVANQTISRMSIVVRA